LNQDGDTLEPLPLDADLNPRVIGAAAMATGTSCRSCHNVRASEGMLVAAPMETVSLARGGVFAPTPVP
jgi:hypothetical protein